MNSQCSIALLESALAGDMPAEREELLHRHLEECESCSAALEQMAGGAAWCREAATLLIGDELDDAVPSREESSDVDFTVEHLEPSDEPNVIGRLGGYDVLEIIGRGGMGVVLKGFDRELKRCVAIKVLSPHLAQSSLARKRFAREAQAAAAVVHPNVLAIHQVQPSGRLPFLVMPLVAGESLAERLVVQGRLDLKETLRIGMQAAAGLAAAHEQGLVHRDVKPANILLEKGVERAVLTDFGLARAADDVSMTRWGIIAGTPQYMSPEQAQGEPLDGRSDLFSLGCVLYEMATGVSPFRADSTVATLRRLIDDPPPAIASLNPELPPWFIGIVDRLLEKDPSRRFGSAKEVSELLEGCLAHLQQPTSVPLPAAIPKPATRASAKRGNIFRKGVILMLSTLGIAFLGMLLVQATDPPDIAGKWSSEETGQLLLDRTSSGEYSGSYQSGVGQTPGKIELSWSRLQRRFNGTWREGDDCFGELSVRLVDNEIRGARTIDSKSKVDPATPRLADLSWTRIEAASQNAGTGSDVPWGGTTETHSSISFDSSKAGMLLSKGILKFNQLMAQHIIGQEQSPLTDDEVVTSIRAISDFHNQEQLTDEELKQLHRIVEERILPEGWHFEVTTEIPGVDNERFLGWLVQLMKKRADGSNAIHEVRRRLLCQIDSQGNPLPDTERLPTEGDAIPLDSAIFDFNEKHSGIGSMKQKPLTENEVIAAIRWWKACRKEAPVNDSEFAAFQKIADTHQLPKGTRLEVVSQFRPTHEKNYFIWSIRIQMPRSESGTYAYLIRKQYIRSEGIDAQRLKDLKIAWGPVGAEGLQVGVRVEPLNEVYMAGQQVTPVFCFRNTGQSTLDASFPRLMTHGYYDKIIVIDATGKEIPLEQDPAPRGPAGWIELPLSPGDQHEIRGLPIMLGDVDRGSAETVIRAKPGQSIRIRFELRPDLRPKDAKSLQTGELLLSIDESAGFDRSKGKPDEFAATLLKTYRANRDKLKCGILSWTRMTMNDGFARKSRKYETVGTYKLWWDGDKIATAYMEDRVTMGTDGANFSIDAHSGGSAYDGDAFSAKPKRNFSENWLEYVTRWNSRDKLILTQMESPHVKTEWSVSDLGGEKQLKLLGTNLQDGAYGVQYFDLSRGGQPLSEESYTAQKILYAKRTYKLREVSGGVWFPVEVEEQSIEDGKVTLHQHYALDMERCSFNDRAAIPAGIFSLSAGEIEHKYQDELKKGYEKAKSATQQAEAKKQPQSSASQSEADVRSLLDRFEDAINRDDQEAIARLFVKRMKKDNAANVIREMKECIKLGATPAIVRLANVRGDRALVATDFFEFADSRYKGKQCLVYRLERDNDEWRIQDIGMENVETLAEEIRKDSLQENPGVSLMDDVTLMQHLIDTVRANKGTIRTWKGTAICEYEREDVRDGETCSESCKRSIEFAIDATRQRYRSKIVVDKLERSVDGVKESRLLPDTYAGMLKGGKYYEYYSYSPDKKGTVVVDGKPVTKRGSEMTPSLRTETAIPLAVKKSDTFFDPLTHMDYEFQDYTAGFGNLISELKEKGTRSLPPDFDLNEKDGILAYSRTISEVKEKKLFTTKITFDLNKGGLIIKSHHVVKENGKVVSERSAKIVPQEVGGVWIPKVRIETISEPDCKLNHQLTWTTNEINIPVDDEFTIAKMKVAARSNEGIQP